MRRRAAAPRATLEDLLFRARGELQWLSRAPFDAAKADAISAQDAEAISDHADEAEEALLGPLMALRPDLPELEEAGRIQTPVPRRRLRGKRAKADLLKAVEDTLVLLRGEVQAGIEDAYREAEPSARSLFERLPDDVEEAAVSIEAALLTLEPDYYKQELALETDADERIAKAAHLEFLEARRDEMRDTNDFHRLVSDASKKISAIEASNGATAAVVSRLIADLNHGNTESSVHQLIEAADLSEEEARAFVGFYLIPQKLG